MGSRARASPPHIAPEANKLAATVLSLVLSFILGAAVWLAIGPRLSLNADGELNQTFNFFAYVGIAFPFVFAAVFFLLEKL